MTSENSRDCTIRTNVSNDEILGLEILLRIGIAVDKGFVVRSDILQQFLVRVVLDATIIKSANRHVVNVEGNAVQGCWLVRLRIGVGVWVEE